MVLPRFYAEVLDIESKKTERAQNSAPGLPQARQSLGGAQLDTRTIFDSLAPQRSAGRGLGRGDFELKTSSPRPSPPASLGGEGVISRSDFRKFNPLFGAGAKLRLLGAAVQYLIVLMRSKMRC